MNHFIPYSLNDVCCYVPVWFGVIATLLLSYMTFTAASASSLPIGSQVHKITSSNTIVSQQGARASSLWYSRLNQALAAGMCMSIIPAHIMRSVG